MDKNDTILALALLFTINVCLFMIYKLTYY